MGYGHWLVTLPLPLMNNLNGLHCWSAAHIHNAEHSGGDSQVFGVASLRFNTIWMPKQSLIQLEVGISC